MSQPHTTMFYVDGQTTAVLVTRDGTQMTSRPLSGIASAEAALAWCRAQSVPLLWMPAAPNPEKN